MDFHDNKARFLYRVFMAISWRSFARCRTIKKLPLRNPKRKIFAVVIQREGYPENSHRRTFARLGGEPYEE
jgi:hypothetical protein